MQASTTPAQSPLWVIHKGREYVFTEPFDIGRGDHCGLPIPDDHVSRRHAEVVLENGRWWIRDAGSANGLYFQGERTEKVPVLGTISVRLGVEGPTLDLSLTSQQQPARSTASSSVQQKAVLEAAQHYFTDSGSDVPAGERTTVIRLAFDIVRRRQRKRNLLILAAMTIAVVATLAFGAFHYNRANRQTVLAEEIFYSMKSLEVDIAGVEKLVAASGSPEAAQSIAKYNKRRRDLEQNYNLYLTNLGIYDAGLSAQDKLILRVARIFGECEVAMPPDFRHEIGRYIKAWQSTSRFARAIARARDNRYTAAIVQEFLNNNLPPQYFYLALQESDFDEYTSGPPTRKGIAKGMWQFIPETAAKYDLRVGPLAEYRRPDPADDRHNWRKSTKAAARYIKDIYATDAQASGLLVMASYNWGEDRVISLLRTLPANPRERNYWKLLTAHRDKLPPETYDYVLSIVSAAVIGEEPRLFGFPFDSPTALAEAQTTQPYVGR